VDVSRATSPCAQRTSRARRRGKRGSIRTNLESKGVGGRANSFYEEDEEDIQSRGGCPKANAVKEVVHLVHAQSATARCLRRGDDDDKEVTFKAMRGLRCALRVGGRGGGLGGVGWGKRGGGGRGGGGGGGGEECDIEIYRQRERDIERERALLRIFHTGNFLGKRNSFGKGKFSPDWRGIYRALFPLSGASPAH
jgi:hypothetical protein